MRLGMILLGLSWAILIFAAEPVFRVCALAIQVLGFWLFFQCMKQEIIEEFTAHLDKKPSADAPVERA